MREHSLPRLSRLLWNWPWYLLAALAATMTGLLSSSWPRLLELAIFAFLAALVMLRERLPEALVLPAALLAWLLALLPSVLGLSLDEALLLASLVCVLLFLSQFTWRLIRPEPLWLAPAVPAQLLALGGQAMIVLIYFDLMTQTQTGALALTVLGLLVVWLALLQPRRAFRLWMGYTAGFLFTLALTWEIWQRWQPTFDLLCLPLASYLVVLSPFLLRDRQTRGSQRVGRVAIVIGACLLLIPSFILSIVAAEADQQLVSLLLVLAESLSLFTFGIAMRVRFFVLGGAALVVGGAIRAVVYTFLGGQHYALIIWTALGIAGLALLGGAIFLTLRRSSPQL
ncbi:MAG: hypothetical protein IMW90_00850 [Thermogemmatispora sp.]|jgi:hypothetical protein|uniref:hypothetical protein n=1 Tax=Thermogemmatispora sp. TaxID=1968838 RepID=UPI001A0CDA43|nr:hypothetical protein [Thermogemmatispora sp.]MBE3564256.1 hypothetical protein [Thermogemmatispora sp.]